MPAEPTRPFMAIILAAQRGGRLDPLAAEAGVTHKCLVPIVGRPLLEYVLEAIAPVPGLERIRIAIEPEAFEAVRSVYGVSGERGVPVELVPSAETITESIYAAAAGVEGPMVLTTADNVNLTPGAVQKMLDAVAGGADAALALVTRSAVLAVNPEAQRRFYELADDAYSNCNLYAIASPKALESAETFREGGQFAKNPKRLLRIIGLINGLLFRFKLVGLETGMKRLSKRLGLRLEAVVLEDGTHAIDVDNARTYRIAETVLLAKAAAKG